MLAGNIVAIHVADSSGAFDPCDWYATMMLITASSTPESLQADKALPQSHVTLFLSLFCLQTIVLYE